MAKIGKIRTLTRLRAGFGDAQVMEYGLIVALLAVSVLGGSLMIGSASSNNFSASAQPLVSSSN